MCLWGTSIQVRCSSSRIKHRLSEHFQLCRQRLAKIHLGRHQQRHLSAERQGSYSDRNTERWRYILSAAAVTPRGDLSHVDRWHCQQTVDVDIESTLTGLRRRLELRQSQRQDERRVGLCVAGRIDRNRGVQIAATVRCARCSSSRRFIELAASPRCQRRGVVLSSSNLPSSKVPVARP